MKYLKISKYLIFLTAILSVAFISASPVYAAGCGSSVTVVSGDTLYKIAARCGTTVSALRRANPEVGWSNLIYPGQILQLPGTILGTDGGYFVYVVAQGDTLRGIAIRFGTTVDALLAGNPEIANPNSIYAGQWVKVYTEPIPAPPPPVGQVYYAQFGDTLRKIATKFDTTVDAILKVNPGISNPNLIYIGQTINLPAGLTSHVVAQGETLRIIASRYGTSVDAILTLNPSITNPNWIYVGQVIRVW